MIRALLSAIFACAGVFFAVVMPVGALLATRRLILQGKDRHVSSVPIIGTVAGCLAVVLLPVGTLRERLVWAWPLGVVEPLVLGACMTYWGLSGLEKKAEQLRRARRP